MDTSYAMNKIAKFQKKITWWRLILTLVVLAVIIYGYLFWARSNFSASAVTVSIEAPETFKAQEKVELQIKLKNNSKFELHNVAVYVTLPEFLSFEGESGGEKKVEFENLAKKKESVKIITVFANETQKEGLIKARAEYTPKNLNGAFESVGSKQISVASLPLTVIFDIPQKAVNGQQLRGSFHFVAEHELESLPLAARIILPEDFSLGDAEPKPKDTTTWIFEKIEPKETYEVDFEGIIKGHESETKKFSLLFGSINNENVFSEQYRVFREVQISSAPLEFLQTVNGSALRQGSGQAGSPQDGKSEYASLPGEKLNFRIDYKNKSGVDIEDATLTAQFSGDYFDFNSLNTGSGYFNSGTKTIVWNKDFMPELSALEKDESGSVEFFISLKDNIIPKTYRDKNISLKSTAIIDSSKTPLALRGLSLRAESTAQIKLRTSLELESRAHYYEGPFSNSGPIPPRVGEKTTYTISWQIKNSFNEMSDVRIEVPLSRDVVFEEKTYPFANKLSYDSQAHSVVWDIGGLSWGLGYIFPVESVAFQVSLTPTDEMRGKTVELADRAKVSGTDTFTDEFIEFFVPVLDTTLPTDVGIRDGDGVVQ